MSNPFLAYGLAAVATYLLLKKEEVDDSTSPVDKPKPKPKPGAPEGEEEEEPESEPEADPNELPTIPSMNSDIVVFSENQEHYKIGSGYRYRVMECWMAQQWCAGKIIGKYDEDEASSWSEDPSDFLGDGVAAEIIFAIAAEAATGLALVALGVSGWGAPLALGTAISYFVGEGYILPAYHQKAMESTAAGALVEFMETMKVTVGIPGKQVLIGDLKDTPATRAFIEDYLMKRITYFQSQQMDRDAVCTVDGLKSVCVGTSS